MSSWRQAKQTELVGPAEIATVCFHIISNLQITLAMRQKKSPKIKHEALYTRSSLLLLPPLGPDSFLSKPTVIVLLLTDILSYLSMHIAYL
jgi:hypothetical protein